MNAPLRKSSLAPVRKGDVVYIRAALTPELRQRIEAAVERTLHMADCLIGLLDGIDTDPDLELEPDAEPSLGWRGEGRGAISFEPGQDLEEQCEDEGIDTDREGDTDDNGVADLLGAWEQGLPCC